MPSSVSDPIRITTPDDWQKLIESKRTTVVDPMVFRAGEIFLRGVNGQNMSTGLNPPLDKDAAWGFLQANLLTLGFFFDALLLNDRLPIFNYDDSYDMQLNFDQRSFAVFNDVAQDAVIAPVDVRHPAYKHIKERALNELLDRLKHPGPDGGAWMPMAQAQALDREMSQSAYRWEVSLGLELEQLLPSELDRQIARLLVGGIIFGQYADLLQSEHWLQPKRASLLVRAATGGGARSMADEKQLFEWMAKRYGLPIMSTWQPTFFHQILESAKQLEDIPGIIVELRASGAVRDYRAWRRQALHEWRHAGGLSKESVKTIKRLQDELARQEPGLALVGEAGVALVDAAVTPDPARVAEAAAKTLPLLGWVMDHVPGRRHVKLLADSFHARDRHPHIERAVRSLWVG